MPNPLVAETRNIILIMSSVQDINLVLSMLHIIIIIIIIDRFYI